MAKASGQHASAPLGEMTDILYARTKTVMRLVLVCGLKKKEGRLHLHLQLRTIQSAAWAGPGLGLSGILPDCDREYRKEMSVGEGAEVTVWAMVCQRGAVPLPRPSARRLAACRRSGHCLVFQQR